jgi:hypothetical protein
MGLLCHTEILFVIPRQPAVRMSKEIGAVSPQCGQILKWVNVVEEAGMDEAHEHVADIRPMLGFVKERVFPV